MVWDRAVHCKHCKGVLISEHHFKGRIASYLSKNWSNRFWPIAAVIPVVITGHPVITKWGDYSTLDISTVVLKDI